MREITATERRARLARRHRLAPGCRAADVVEATRSVVCLHATDPATVYLSAWARVDGFAVADLDREMYGTRSLVKHLAMRRTLFVFPRETLPAVQAGASDRVAQIERRRLIRDVERAGLYADAAGWLDAARAAVLAALVDGREATWSELRDDLPVLQGKIMYGVGKSWGGDQPVGPRVLTGLSADGMVVRSSNNGRWSVSRPRWTTMEAWLGEEITPLSATEAVAELVRGWLRAFGPGTVADLKWWLGSTVAAVRQALADLSAEQVAIDGPPAYVLPDDLEPEEPVEPWAALLPPLDPATMGWIGRDWYLGPHKPQIFDSTGNGGATAWWDGRIVGGWRPRGDDEIELQLLEDVGAEARTALEAEAARLRHWLGGGRILPRFPSPLWKR